MKVLGRHGAHDPDGFNGELYWLREAYLSRVRKLSDGENVRVGIVSHFGAAVVEMKKRAVSHRRYRGVLPEKRGAPSPPDVAIEADRIDRWLFVFLQGG